MKNSSGRVSGAAAFVAGGSLVTFTSAMIFVLSPLLGGAAITAIRQLRRLTWSSCVLARMTHTDIRGCRSIGAGAVRADRSAEVSDVGNQRLAGISLSQRNPFFPLDRKSVV